MKVFPWADIAPKKAAFKLHLGLDHDGLIPAFAEVSGGLESEMDVAEAFAFPRGSVVVFDRGYSRYTWHKQLTERGIFWVTRARKGMVHEVVKTSPVPEDGPVVRDQIIRLTSRKALQADLPEIRRVEYRDPETGKVYVFLTNHRRWAAQTVADIYKSRWEVELFFKWIKQNLKIRSFLGHSMNAVCLADLRGPVCLPAGGLPEVRLALRHRHPGRPTLGAIEPVSTQTLGRSPSRSKTGSTRSPDASAAEGRLSGTAVGATAVVSDPILIAPAFCTKQRVPASNPDSAYVDHGNGTVTHIRTGLMWKQCAEGLNGAIMPDRYRFRANLQLGQCAGPCRVQQLRELHRLAFAK
jgi:hypothetical protein